MIRDLRSCAYWIRIQLLIDRQMADLTWQQQYATAPNTFDTEVFYHLAYGKRTMDEIRINLNAMQSEEDRLLPGRVQKINTIQQRDYLAIIFALFTGLGARLIARYFFHKGKASGSGMKV
jgi:hypothetical protein